MAAFHEGEQALQAEAGAARRLAEVGPRFIRDHMPQQHRDFFAQLPFVVLGALDEGGHPWASLVAGAPGFMHSPDPARLRIGVSVPGLAVGAPVGLLGIEAHTRRRNRLNGVVDEVDASGFEVAVRQSFGNCPKYIQPREAVHDASIEAPAPARATDVLDGDALALIRRSDTFFIATAHPRARQGGVGAEGVDVSHRGGPAGFVEAGADGRTLRVADYPGNSYFNTLGNLLLEPRCGLLFVDYGSATVLEVAAEGEVVRAPERQLVLRPTHAVMTRHAVPLRWR